VSARCAPVELSPVAAAERSGSAAADMTDGVSTTPLTAGAAITLCCACTEKAAAVAMEIRQPAEAPAAQMRLTRSVSKPTQEVECHKRRVSGR